MKHIFLLFSCLALALAGYAQAPYVPAKNAVQIGSDYLGVDPANGLKYRFAFGYQRYMARDRSSLSLSVGFMSSQRTTVLVPDFVSVGKNTRRRITIDMTASYNLLHSVHHALRVGLGPSLWNSNDDLFLKVEPYPVPSGTPIYAQRLQTENWDIGGHGKIEYTYALSLNTQVSLHSGAVIIGPSGFAPMFGLRAGYRF
ncbi:hypothetical protein [uncultured Fibrella sp.]|uniref:hypothetical protein n=1 Tax=uncultured Fibrella sp. TaxID=1284596 RepID=UPI0035CC075D